MSETYRDDLLQYYNGTGYKTLWDKILKPQIDKTKVAHFEVAVDDLLKVFKDQETLTDAVVWLRSQNILVEPHYEPSPPPLPCLLWCCINRQIPNTGSKPRTRTRTKTKKIQSYFIFIDINRRSEF